MTAVTLPPHKQDLKSYYESMRGSLEDKLFFMDELPEESVAVLVDYGAGDGALLREVAASFSGWGPYLVAYDRAYEHHGFFADIPAPSLETCAWPPVLKKIKGRKSCLILSSVIHEVLTADPECWDTWWADIEDAGFDYIVIRDTAVSWRTYTECDDLADLRVAYHWLHPGPETTSFAGRLAAHAKMATADSDGYVSHAEYLHFLLKYRYVDNWERELAENYIPLPAEVLRGNVLASGKYRLKHYEHYTLPFLKEVVKADFGIDLVDPTHVKMILEKT